MLGDLERSIGDKLAGLFVVPSSDPLAAADSPYVNELQDLVERLRTRARRTEQDAKPTD